MGLGDKLGFTLRTPGTCRTFCGGGVMLSFPGGGVDCGGAELGGGAEGKGGGDEFSSVPAPLPLKHKIS